MTDKDQVANIGNVLSEWYSEVAMVIRALGNSNTEILAKLSGIDSEVDQLWEKVSEIEQRLEDGGVEPPEPIELEVILVVVENESDANCAVYNGIPDGRDKSCGTGLGKPEYGSNKLGRFENGARFEIYAKFKDNCHDSADDPWIHGAYGLYAVVASGPMKGGVVPAKRITLLS